MTEKVQAGAPAELAAGTRLDVVDGGSVVVTRLLGAGGQGQVYAVDHAGRSVALKWYFPASATRDQQDLVRTLLRKGPPDGRFLWPTALVRRQGSPTFGYLMPLRDPRLANVTQHLKCKVDTGFRALATAGAHLAQGFRSLHGSGLCYRDISAANVFFDPVSGDVMICDTDNVGPEQSVAGVLGTPRYMSPEVVAGSGKPTIQSDLHSLAVLLFEMLVVHHPLQGQRELAIHCLDAAGWRQLCGDRALFIHDPADPSNRPVADIHGNALVRWPMLPRFVQELFMRAFTSGLHDPNRRVRESEWESAMSRLRDSVIACACGAKTFHDAAVGSATRCWKCGSRLAPPVLELGKAHVVLAADTRLHPHHVHPRRPIGFDETVGTVERHPTDPRGWGLRNASGDTWTIHTTRGSRPVEPGRVVPLSDGTRIEFGEVVGTLRVPA